MEIYNLTRYFWDFAFDNPEKIRPNHIAIYFFAVEHCNRLGWKEKFGLPTTMVMEAVGIKSYSVYKKTFDDLCSFGLIDVIQFSKNQYSSNIVALKENYKANDKARDKALDKALIKQDTKQVTNQGQYNKTNNQETNKPIVKPEGFTATTEQQESFEKFKAWMKEEVPAVEKMPQPITLKEYIKLIGQWPDPNSPTGYMPGISKKRVIEILHSIENNKEYLKKFRSPYRCIVQWEKKNNN